MSPAGDLLLGGRYQLKERIARGGMGEVWRANDLALGRDVAVKVLRPEIVDDPLFLERFRNEARNTALISHPGIAQVFDYGEDRRYAYLVMELVPGEPLSALLMKEGALSVDRTLDIIGQAALALQAAHDKGVVHRDIKPGNILVMPNGQVKLADFGIARGLGTQTLTQTGRVMGTPHYFSPEQSAGQRATPASDIYALGVVAYECLSGRRPFDAATPVALALAHLREEPPPLPDHIPAGVRALVARAMAKDPAQRPASAAHFGRRLLALRDAYRAAMQATQPPPIELRPPVAPSPVHAYPQHPGAEPPAHLPGYAYWSAPAMPDPPPAPSARPVARPTPPPRIPQPGATVTHRSRPRSRPRRRRGRRLLAWLLLLALLGAGVYVSWVFWRAQARIASLGHDQAVTQSASAIPQPRYAPQADDQRYEVTQPVTQQRPWTKIKVAAANHVDRPATEMCRELRRSGLSPVEADSVMNGKAGTVSSIAPTGTLSRRETARVAVVSADKPHDQAEEGQGEGQEE
ncbi:serine/threonine-protein kinase [Carbonactinospora thermoautotrophica]|uniref:serine/threonine-protein kinase n=1 Tax=Carbonactinospora thermoautotrophica TaxID=1469144 RepID=UPI000A4C81F9|nr:protein kinase [Carbonactinospora thermoautotrophica]